MNTGVQEFCVVLYSKLFKKPSYVNKRFVKIYFHKDTAVASMTLQPTSGSYLVFAQSSFEIGSTVDSYGSNAYNPSNIYFNVAGNCDAKLYFNRNRTNSESGGGVMNVCVINGISTSVTVSATVYGYYDDPRGYQEVEVNMIVIPVA